MPLFDAPGIHNLTIYSGMTFSQRFSPAGTADVFDLSGYTAAAMARDTTDGTATIFSITSGTAAPCITLGGTAGWVQIDFPATTTAAMGSAAGYVERTGVWDIELTSSGGDVTRFAKGVVTIDPDITR